MSRIVVRCKYISFTFPCKDRKCYTICILASSRIIIAQVAPEGKIKTYGCGSQEAIYGAINFCFLSLFSSQIFSVLFLF